MPVSMALGLLLYIAAFFLPAVNGIKGWSCAWVVMNSWFQWPENWQGMVIMVIALFNPAVILFVLREAVGRWRIWRSILTVLVLVAMAAAWLFLFGLGNAYRIQIGHLLWIAGALLIVAPEVSTWRIAIGRGAAPRPSPPTM